MRRHRRHGIEFKREVAQAYLDGQSLYGLAKQHDVCRNLIRLWIKKYEAGEFDVEVEAAKTLREYQAKIAGLGRKVGQLTMAFDVIFSEARSRRVTVRRRRSGRARRKPVTLWSSCLDI